MAGLQIENQDFESNVSSTTVGTISIVAYDPSGPVPFASPLTVPANVELLVYSSIPKNSNAGYNARFRYSVILDENANGTFSNDYEREVRLDHGAELEFTEVPVPVVNPITGTYWSAYLGKFSFDPSSNAVATIEIEDLNYAGGVSTTTATLNLEEAAAQASNTTTFDFNNDTYNFRTGKWTGPGGAITSETDMVPSTSVQLWNLTSSYPSGSSGTGTPLKYPGSTDNYSMYSETSAPADPSSPTGGALNYAILEIDSSQFATSNNVSVSYAFADTAGATRGNHGLIACPPTTPFALTTSQPGAQMLSALFNGTYAPPSLAHVPGVTYLGPGTSAAPISGAWPSSTWTVTPDLPVPSTIVSPGTFQLRWWTSGVSPAAIPQTVNGAPFTFTGFHADMHVDSIDINYEADSSIPTATLAPQPPSISTFSLVPTAYVIEGSTVTANLVMNSPFVGETATYSITAPPEVSLGVPFGPTPITFSPTGTNNYVIPVTDAGPSASPFATLTVTANYPFGSSSDGVAVQDQFYSFVPIRLPTATNIPEGTPYQSFRLSRYYSAGDSAVTVPVTFSGTATFGVDYTCPAAPTNPFSITFPAAPVTGSPGVTTIVQQIIRSADATTEGSETITITYFPPTAPPAGISNTYTLDDTSTAPTGQELDVEMYYNPAPQVLTIPFVGGGGPNYSVSPGPAVYTTVTGSFTPTPSGAGINTITLSDVFVAGDLSSPPIEYLTLAWSGDPVAENKTGVGDDGTFDPAPNPAPNVWTVPPAATSVVVTAGKTPSVGPFISPGMVPNPVGNPAASWKMKFKLSFA